MVKLNSPKHIRPREVHKWRLFDSITKCTLFDLVFELAQDEVAREGCQESEVEQRALDFIRRRASELR